MVEKSKTEKLLFDSETAAESLSISTRSLYRLIATGELATVRVQGARGVRITREELLRFLKFVGLRTRAAMRRSQELGGTSEHKVIPSKSQPSQPEGMPCTVTPAGDRDAE